jgi:hypothetical protein
MNRDTLTSQASGVSAAQSSALLSSPHYPILLKLVTLVSIFPLHTSKVITDSLPASFYNQFSTMLTDLAMSLLTVPDSDVPRTTELLNFCLEFYSNCLTAPPPLSVVLACPCNPVAPPQPSPEEKFNPQSLTFKIIYDPKTLHTLLSVFTSTLTAMNVTAPASSINKPALVALDASLSDLLHLIIRILDSVSSSTTMAPSFLRTLISNLIAAIEAGAQTILCLSVVNCLIKRNSVLDGREFKRIVGGVFDIVVKEGGVPREADKTSAEVSLQGSDYVVKCNYTPLPDDGAARAIHSLSEIATTLSHFKEQQFSTFPGPYTPRENDEGSSPYSFSFSSNERTSSLEPVQPLTLPVFVRVVLVAFVDTFSNPDSQTSLTTRLHAISLINSIITNPMLLPYFLSASRITGLWNVLCGPNFILADEIAVDEYLDGDATSPSAAGLNVHLTTMSLDVLPTLLDLSSELSSELSKDLLVFSSELQSIVTILLNPAATPYIVTLLCRSLKNVVEMEKVWEGWFSMQDRANVVKLIVAVFRRLSHRSKYITEIGEQAQCTASVSAALDLLAAMVRKEPSASTIHIITKLCAPPLLDLCSSSKIDNTNGSKESKEAKFLKDNYDVDEWGERMSSRFSGGNRGSSIRKTSGVSSAVSSLEQRISEGFGYLGGLEIDSFVETLFTLTEDESNRANAFFIIGRIAEHATVRICEYAKHEALQSLTTSSESMYNLRIISAAMQQDVPRSPKFSSSPGTPPRRVNSTPETTPLRKRSSEKRSHTPPPRSSDARQPNGGTSSSSGNSLLCGCLHPHCESLALLNTLSALFSRIFAALSASFSTMSSAQIDTKTLMFLKDTLESVQAREPDSFPFLRFFVITRYKAVDALSECLTAIQTAVQSSEGVHSASDLQALTRWVIGCIAGLHGKNLPICLTKPLHLNPLDIILYDSAFTSIPDDVIDVIESTVGIIENTFISKETVDALFCLLNGGVVSTTTTLAVNHPTTIPLIFKMLPRTNQLLQKKILDTITLLLLPENVARMVNKGVCSHGIPDTSLLDLTLGIFSQLPMQTQKTASVIIQELASYYITVPQLKRIFRLMQVNANSTRSEHLETILTALSNMVSPSTAFKRYFIMDGISSGFVLPTVPGDRAGGCFTSKGYSFCASFMIDGEGAPTSPSQRSQNPKLKQDVCVYHFSDEKSNSISLHLIPSVKTRGLYTVKVTTTTSRSSHEVSVLQTLTVLPDTWYFIGVSHTPNTLLSTGKLIVILNPCASTTSSELVLEQTKHLYPSFTKSKSVSGSFCVSSTTSDRCFSGRIGSLYFFNSSLANDVLGRLCFSDFTAFLRSTKNPRTVVDPLLSKLFVSCTPGMVQHSSTREQGGERRSSLPQVFSESAINSPSPDRKQSLPLAMSSSSTDSSLTVTQAPLLTVATFLTRRGTSEAVTLNFNDALGCIGGLDAIFPIFAQLDQPILDLDAGDSALKYVHNPNLSKLLMKLLSDLILNSEDCRTVISLHGGFGIVSYFLSNLDPRHMTASLLTSISKLEESCRRHKVLHQSVVNDLLTNFRFWVFASTNVQLSLLGCIYDKLVSSPSVAIALRAKVSYFLDSLHLFFWYHRPNGRLSEEYSLSERRHVVTGEVMGQRAVGEDLKKIRSKVFEIIHVLFRININGSIDYDVGPSSAVLSPSGIKRSSSEQRNRKNSKSSSVPPIPKPTTTLLPMSASEVQNIIECLISLNPSDSDGKTEVLKMILRCLFDESQRQSFVRHLMSPFFPPNNGLEVLISFAGEPNGEIQELVVAIVSMVVHVWYQDDANLHLSRLSASAPRAVTSQMGFGGYVPPPSLMRSMSASSHLANQGGGVASSGMLSASAHLPSSQNFFADGIAFDLNQCETGSSTSSITMAGGAGSPNKPPQYPSRVALVGSYNLETQSSSHSNAGSNHNDHSNAVQSSPPSFDINNFHSSLPVILKWLDERISEVRSTDGDSSQDSGMISPPEPTMSLNNELYINALVSMMFKNPTFSLVNSCVSALNVLEYGSPCASVVKNTFDSYAAGRSSRCVPQDKIKSLLISLDADIKSRTRQNIRTTADLEADVLLCQNTLGLTSNTTHLVHYEEFYSWYSTHFSQPDADFQGFPNKRVIRDGNAFCAVFEVLGQKCISDSLKSATLVNLFYVVQCYENALMIASVFGWQEKMLRVLGKMQKSRGDYGDDQLGDQVLLTMCEIHVLLLCSENSKVVEDGLAILRDSMSICRIESMNGRLRQGKKPSIRLLCFIVEEVNKRKNKSDAMLMELMSICLEVIFLPLPITGDGGGTPPLSDITGELEVIRAQFQLVIALVDCVGRIALRKAASKEGGNTKKGVGEVRGDLLTDGRGLVRSLVVTLEQFGSAIIEQARRGRKFTAVDDASSFQEVVTKVMEKLSSLLVSSYHFETSEEAAYNTVRLVELLRRFKENRCEDPRFPFSLLCMLVTDLSSSHSTFMWQDLELLKPSGINMYIRDRSDSQLGSDSYFTTPDLESNDSASDDTGLYLGSTDSKSYDKEEEETLGKELERKSLEEEVKVFDEIISAIAQGMQIDPALLDWERFDNAFKESLAFSIRQEDAAVLSRLDELGLSDSFTTTTRQKLAILATMSSSAVGELYEKINEHVFSFRVDNVLRIEEQFKSRQEKGKFARERWRGILEELANERGPWGQRTNYNEEGAVASFWILDDVYNEKGIRCKFKRNPRGTQHRVASSLSRGEGRRKRPTVPTVDADMLESIVREVGGTDGPGGGVSVEWASTGLMNDLKKYQRRATMHVIDVSEVEGSTTEKNDEDSVISSSTKQQQQQQQQQFGEPPKKRNSKQNPLETSVSASTVTAATTAWTSSAASGTSVNKNTSYSFKNCYLVHLNGKTLGDIELLNESITFSAAASHLQDEIETRDEMQSWSWVTEPIQTCTYEVKEITDMRFRRYQQQPLSLEVLFAGCKSAVIAFASREDCKEFHRLVRYQFKPPFLKPFLGTAPRQVILRTKASYNKKLVTRAWVGREITTFDYLIALNSIAGRSFSDVTQYPVFPWVLSNYESETLDLKDSKNYRDFEWPMGAQTEERREVCRERYAGLEQCYNPNDPNCDTRDLLPPFHHGTHYSCPGFVIWFLMRIEPFTSLHLQLQAGKFDKSDRHFQSLQGAWRSCTGNQGDVKELIPEFFFMPEFLRNDNDLDLGITQQGTAVDDVELPKWAKSAEDFVRIHREALESEHVSRNIHKWIDLVFGYKSRPPTLAGGSMEAVKACNVFFHLTYNDAVDLGRMKDEDEGLYLSYIKQIENFGQGPTLLFTKFHPPRTELKKDSSVIWPFCSSVPGANSVPKGGMSMPDSINSWRLGGCSSRRITYLFEREDYETLITVDAGGVTGNHLFSAVEEDMSFPFRFAHDDVSLNLCNARARSSSRSILPLKGSKVGYGNTLPPSGRRVTGRMGALHDSRMVGGWGDFNAGGRGGERLAVLSSGGDFGAAGQRCLLFSCGYDDNSIQVNDLATGRFLQGLVRHKDVVSCVCLAEGCGGRGEVRLISGSRDCTVMIFKVDAKATVDVIESAPLRILYGHDAWVSGVAVNVCYDVVVSASEDGSVIVHSLNSGQYIRTIGGSYDETIAAKRNSSDAAGDKKDVVDDGEIAWVGVSSSGYIATYSSTRRLLRVYSINGRLLAQRRDRHVYHAFCWSFDGQFLICGGARQIVLFLNAADLSVLSSLPNLERSGDKVGDKPRGYLDGSCDLNDTPPFSSAITSLSLGEGERTLFVGLANGEVYCLRHNKNYLRKRFEKQLQSLGFF